jgi:hypothetical protein
MIASGQSFRDSRGPQREDDVMEISRRKFIEFSSKASAAALLSRLVDVDTVFGDE